MVWGAIASIASAGIGMIASSGKDKAAKKQSDYQNKMAERQVEWQIKNNEVQRNNNLRNAAFQDQTNLQNWKMQIDMQNFGFANKLEAKRHSDAKLGAQLQYNREATDAAINAQKHWLEERELDHRFNLMDLDLELGKGDNAMDAAFNEIILNAAMKRDAAFSQMDMVQAERGHKLDETAFASQENQVNMLMNAGKAQNSGTVGRSSNRTIDSITAAGGREEAKLTHQAEIIFKLAALSMDKLNTDLLYVNREADVTRKKVGQQYIDLAKTVSLGRVKSKNTLASATRQHWVNMQGIALSKKQHDMNAWADNLLMPRRGPTPPAPFATPIPEILDPEDHVWSPSPSSGVGILSSIGSALPGIVGGFSSIGSTPTKTSWGSGDFSSSFGGFN